MAASEAPGPAAAPEAPAEAKKPPVAMASIIGSKVEELVDGLHFLAKYVDGPPWELRLMRVSPR